MSCNQKDNYCKGCGELCWGTHCRECYEKKGANLSRRKCALRNYHKRKGVNQ